MQVFVWVFTLGLYGAQVWREIEAFDACQLNRAVGFCCDQGRFECIQKSKVFASQSGSVDFFTEGLSGSLWTFSAP